MNESSQRRYASQAQALLHQSHLSEIQWVNIRHGELKLVTLSK